MICAECNGGVTLGGSDGTTRYYVPEISYRYCVNCKQALIRRDVVQVGQCSTCGGFHCQHIVTAARLV